MKKFRQSASAMLSLIIIFAFFGISVAAAEEDILFYDEATGTSYTSIVIDGSFWIGATSPHLRFTIIRHRLTPRRSPKMKLMSISELKWQNAGYAFVGNQYLFLVDGKGYTFDIIPASGSLEDGLNTMYVVRSNGYKVVSEASAILSRQSGQPDELEMMIPLDFFYRNPSMLQTITFSSSNLGSQSITATGVSTAPIFFIASGLVAIGADISFEERLKHDSGNDIFLWSLGFTSCFNGSVKLPFSKFMIGSVGFFVLMMIVLQPIITFPLAKAVAAATGVIGGATGAFIPTISIHSYLFVMDQSYFPIRRL